MKEGDCWKKMRYKDGGRSSSRRVTIIRKKREKRKKSCWKNMKKKENQQKKEISGLEDILEKGRKCKQDESSCKG